jgi:hypothetical protein
MTGHVAAVNAPGGPRDARVPRQDRSRREPALLPCRRTWRPEGIPGRHVGHGGGGDEETAG